MLTISWFAQTRLQHLTIVAKRLPKLFSESCAYSGSGSEKQYCLHCTVQHHPHLSACEQLLHLKSHMHLHLVRKMQLMQVLHIAKYEHFSASSS